MNNLKERARVINDKISFLASQNENLEQNEKVYERCIDDASAKIASLKELLGVNFRNRLNLSELIFVTKGFKLGLYLFFILELVWLFFNGQTFLIQQIIPIMFCNISAIIVFFRMHVLNKSAIQTRKINLKIFGDSIFDKGRIKDLIKITKSNIHSMLNKCSDIEKEKSVNNEEIKKLNLLLNEVEKLIDLGNVNDSVMDETLEEGFFQGSFLIRR